ncbi:ead/Ea22-like family protein [Citrobacter braakii]|uniref:ead/Ea22-like family protein n=1 Tax=Citrobacter braakii TaxID=57706 RepID=UPI001CC35D76|nr:ead/Ea22-like family protein [Citrobacter braakii]MDT7116683.1 ead/Ea22-like family protein [Citrobacter braakii]
MTALNKQALRERYSSQPVPKCHICGAEMTIQRAGGGSLVYGCTGRVDSDGEGYVFAEGRDFADNHYALSRVTVANDSDPDVLALLDELEAAEKRIAELDGNEIREEVNQFLVVRHPGKTPVIKHCSGDLEEFLRNLIEQDPLVTIDIITHRYYGVGGQWVQDADEYLHMMAAAGIGVKGE